MSQVSPCFICEGAAFSRSVDYRRCLDCGHETLMTDCEQHYIVNDVMSEAELKRVATLDRFKRDVLMAFDSAPERSHLLDIGSASGKFLYQNGPRYQRATGIEVTQEALDFSRQHVSSIVEHIREVEAPVHIATAWHSLEHIPEGALLELLDGLAQKMAEGGQLIVSVPNNDSLQSRLLGSSYAYYDVPNHLHQFSHESLGRLMARYGFFPKKTVRSWFYNTFGYTQGLLNVATGTHNYLYYRLKRRNLKPSLYADVQNALLLVNIVPVSCVLGTLESLTRSRQGVQTLCFERRTS